jgi:hypothetical protein
MMMMMMMMIFFFVIIDDIIKSETKKVALTLFYSICQASIVYAAF